MRVTRARASDETTTVPSSSSDSRDVVELPYEIWERIIARIIRSEKWDKEVGSYVQYHSSWLHRARVRWPHGIVWEEVERRMGKQEAEVQNYEASTTKLANVIRAKRCGRQSRRSAARVKRFDASWTDQSGEMCVERRGRR